VEYPGDIAARDLLPHLRQNPNIWLPEHLIVDAPRRSAWSQNRLRKIIPAEFPYAIRQLPGPTTGSGLMLDSPNDFDVYLQTRRQEILRIR